MDVKAIAKDVRISPIKLRLMVDLIRGKDVNEALNILTNYTSKPARIVKKVVESAASNATFNNGLDKDKLYIKTAVVDMGSTLKRRVPGSKGKVEKFYHRRSHVTIVVSER
ncbi:MAG: 50S ribosomal protein L22 [bacterium]|nr:50S ribosomal protein L22 [bacterium]